MNNTKNQSVNRVSEEEFLTETATSLEGKSGLSSRSKRRHAAQAHSEIPEHGYFTGNQQKHDFQATRFELKKSRKNQRIGFFSKLFLSSLVVYIGIAIVLYFVRLNTYDYFYKNPKWANLAASILIQPSIDLFVNRKTTYFFDWQEIDRSIINSSVAPLTLRSRNLQLGSYRTQISSENLQVSLGYTQEAAIISPTDYDGYWSLIFCAKSEEICKKNDIFHKQEIKIILNGEVELWGVSQDGEFVRLKLVRYININQNRDLLFI